MQEEFVVRKLLLLALVGMVFSKVHFGSFVPPEVKIHAPGFDLTKDGAPSKPPARLPRRTGK
jgi:hypothetical protein